MNKTRQGKIRRRRQDIGHCGSGVAESEWKTRKFAFLVSIKTCKVPSCLDESGGWSMRSEHMCLLHEMHSRGKGRSFLWRAADIKLWRNCHLQVLRKLRWSWFLMLFA